MRVRGQRASNNTSSNVAAILMARAADEDRVPPYDGRSTERGESNSSEELSATVERQLSGTKGGGAGVTASPAEERPVDPDEATDSAPSPPTESARAPPGAARTSPVTTARNQGGGRRRGRHPGTTALRDIDPAGHYRHQPRRQRLSGATTSPPSRQHLGCRESRRTAEVEVREEAFGEEVVVFGRALL